MICGGVVSWIAKVSHSGGAGREIRQQKPTKSEDAVGGASGRTS